ncbi:MAG: ThiF family adenylyltransferase [Proteobacteria bacterium]|nr:ThiF family adenylyltransferase [Pseudomonadota bacterium]
MTTQISPNSLHRLVKHVIDSGTAASVDEAEAIFKCYRLAVEIDPAATSDPVQQAILLTIITLGRRVFLGGVTVTGPLRTPLKLSLPLGNTLATAVQALGGIIGEEVTGMPTIVIGGGPRKRCEGFCIRTVATGWRGGIVPISSDLPVDGGYAMPLSGMLAAGLAVNEAFLFVSGGMPAAGRRTVGLSLWRPEREIDWLQPDESEPILTYLPSHLWLIGLGHLGQAYLWGLGLLPYRDPAGVNLVLQDIDIITESTESTSILTDSTMIGKKKTRAMAAWAEQRGFATSLQERTFAADFKRQTHEPAVALCGLDNGAGRRALDQVGFDFIVEAGLGSGHRDFRTMRLHILPGRRAATDIWKHTRKGEKIEDRPAYAKLLADGVLDRCGMTLLAGKAVGAPFVGSVAASLALSEVLRLLHGGVVHQLIDIDLLSLSQRLVSRHPKDFANLNPGFVMAV